MGRNKKVKKVIKNNISKYRIWKKYKQRDLSIMLGVSIGTLSLYERGLKAPNEEITEKILSLFGVSFDQMFEEDL